MIHVIQVASLLFLSGMCALVYQMAWLRELRLVFGGTTASSAAVLAIFMGGLGLGGALLGRRANAHPKPLLLYSNLEGLIALTAGLSPLLIFVIRLVYIHLGGSVVLGLPFATVIRLVFSALILGVPTFLMGGTLPAAAKAVETSHDVHRSYVAWLYGLNTLGAVAGASVATFYLFEAYGTRYTLWLACLLNLVVALLARQLAQSTRFVELAEDAVKAQQDAAGSADGTAVSPRFVFAAAAIVGFAFFLMELVWFRMLGPILGGTTYTFGLILAVALLGIGVGGALYAFTASRIRARVAGFAWTVGLEALLLAVPFALGDRVALFSQVTQALGALGFDGFIGAWFLVTLVVVFPASVVSGYQFPLLIALLGRGTRDVGKHTGYAYAWNTGGAIAGSLAGGFGLLPLFSAPGTWVGVVTILAALGGVAAILTVRSTRRFISGLGAGATATAAVALVFSSTGPTAVWRHSGIGAGRPLVSMSDMTGLHDSINGVRRALAWEAEGVECSVGLTNADGYAFVINGKIDGNVISDAPTQIMFPLVGAALHPAPRKAFVIGLGTGCSAGWLAEVPSMERVDVAELEPAIVEVARVCAPANYDAMNHPKVRLVLGDARETLLCAPDTYDLIVSEPSNPYRAGIASLYTREFYEAVAGRLGEGGIFVQWMQAYEIDSQTVRTVYCTLGSVFDCVTTWQTDATDMVLVCSRGALDFDPAALRARLREEPFHTGLTRIWRGKDLESFLSRFVANAEFGRRVGRQQPLRLNTDDRTLIEFGFARSLGREGSFEIDDLRNLAREWGCDRPAMDQTHVDWSLVDAALTYLSPQYGNPNDAPGEPGAGGPFYVRALASYVSGNMGEMLRIWDAAPRGPEYPYELLMVAKARATINDPATTETIAALSAVMPVEALVIEAQYRLGRGETDQAAAALESCFGLCRTYPWAMEAMVQQTLWMTRSLVAAHPEYAQRLAEALRAPFCLAALDEDRKRLAVDVASLVSPAYASSFVEAYEPHVPWEEGFLSYRIRCYEATGNPLAAQAQQDYAQYLAETPAAFGDYLAKLALWSR